MSTTSGPRRRASSTASRPSSASPAMAMSGCVSRIARSPARTSGWSSAISTEMEMRRPYLRLVVAASPRGSMRKSSRGMMRARPARVTIAAVWRPWLAAAFVAGTVISGLPSFDRSRCGIAIPVGLLIVFAAAARRERGDAVISLALVLVGMVVLLLTDPLLDAGALFILPLTAGVWWIGRLVRRRAAGVGAARGPGGPLAGPPGGTARRGGGAGPPGGAAGAAAAARAPR